MCVYILYMHMVYVFMYTDMYICMYAIQLCTPTYVLYNFQHTYMHVCIYTIRMYVHMVQHANAACR